MTKIKLSIRLQCFNHEKYIKKALTSIDNQITNFLFELVIGDDFSTDSTKTIIDNFKFSNTNIKVNILNRVVGGEYYERRKRLGRLYNFVNILEHCQGSYIALLDGDDYWQDPYKLQKQVDFLENNKDYVITYSGVSQLVNGIFESVVMGATYDLTSDELVKCNSINTLTACFRNVLDSYPQEMYSTRFGDLFLWSLLGSYGKGKYLKDIDDSIYRVHEGGVSSQASSRKRLEMYLVTYTSLFAYYSRINNEKNALYFQEAVLKKSLQYYGVRAFFDLLLKKILK